jgi:hypothetical protein
MIDARTISPIVRQSESENSPRTSRGLVSAATDLPSLQYLVFLSQCRLKISFSADRAIGAFTIRNIMYSASIRL